MLGAARTSLDGEDRTVDKKRLKGRPRTVEGGAHNPVDLYVGSSTVKCIAPGEPTTPLTPVIDLW